MPTDQSSNRLLVRLRRLVKAQPGELAALFWAFVYFFSLLCSYYIVRPMRDEMGIAGGVENLQWLFTGTLLAMLAAVPLFGWVSSRFKRRHFLPAVYGFFIVNLLLFFVLFRSDITHAWVARAFFIWASVFNLFVVSVFWSFMADIYSHEQGRRLFGVISAGGSAGALIGPIATSALVVPIGFQNLLPVSAALLLFAVYCITRLRHWVETEHVQELNITAASSQPLGGTALGGLKAVSRSRYLLAISMGSVIASLMGTALYMFMTQLVGAEIAGADERTRLFGYIDGATNGLALVGQLLLVNRSVRRFGVGATLAILPVVSLAGFAILAISPALIAVAILQAVRRGIGFGFAKPTNDMLYSVVTPEEKYKAKNFIDTAVYRGGDLIGTWSVKFVWALGISGISLLMLPLALAWLVIAVWLGRDYQRRDRLGIGGD